MGRRKSLVGSLLKELERSANRAAAEQRRQQRRAEGLRSRALEREMIRAERAAERQRVETERQLANLRVRNEQELSKRLKVESKQAQLREWQLEVEDFRRRDETSLSIANEGPEVEDRDALFAELVTPRPWTAPEFVPPPPRLEDAQESRKTFAEQLEKRAGQFSKQYSTTNAVQLGVAAVAVVGGVASAFPAAPNVAAWASAGAAGAWMILESIWRSRWQRDRSAFFSQKHAELEVALERELTFKAEQRLIAARAEHEQQVASEAARHDEEQSQRIAHARRLLAGDLPSIQAELGDLFPLELSPEVGCESTVESASTLRLALRASLSSALQPQNATNLVSGRPSYRKKTQKQLREEAQQYIAGLVIRHASEAMLFLPSVSEVAVTVSVAAVDPASGTRQEAAVLSARIPFATLAPLQMDGLNPLDALVHFEHKWTQAPVDAEVKRMVS